jgi:hypothetical protein
MVVFTPWEPYVKKEQFADKTVMSKPLDKDAEEPKKQVCVLCQHYQRLIEFYQLVFLIIIIGLMIKFILDTLIKCRHSNKVE